MICSASSRAFPSIRSASWFTRRACRTSSGIATRSWSMRSRTVACSRTMRLVIGTLLAFTASASRRSTRNWMSKVTLLRRQHRTVGRGALPHRAPSSGRRARRSERPADASSARARRRPRPARPRRLSRCHGDWCFRSPRSGCCACSISVSPTGGGFTSPGCRHICALRAGRVSRSARCSRVYHSCSAASAASSRP